MGIGCYVVVVVIYFWNDFVGFLFFYINILYMRLVERKVRLFFLVLRNLGNWGYGIFFLNILYINSVIYNLILFVLIII